VDLTNCRTTHYTVRVHTLLMIRNRPYRVSLEEQMSCGRDIAPVAPQAGLVFDRERISEHARRDEH